MLIEALQRSHEAGQLTEDAARLILEIGESQIHQKRQIPEAARQDAIGRYLLKANQKWQQATGKNPAAWFRSMAYTCLMDELRNHERHLKRLELAKSFEANSNKIHDRLKYVTPKNNLLSEGGITDLRKVSKEVREEIRRYAKNLLDSGISIGEVARHLGAHKRTVSRWKNRKRVKEKIRGKRKKRCKKRKNK